MVLGIGLYDFNEAESEKIIRLPLFYGLSKIQLTYVASSIIHFCK